MKHAYLIIAHNEFNILRLLINAIDDPRNDIFIHFDKKIESYPEIKTEKAGLFILTERVDVRWADVSMVQAELLLFEEAHKRGGYSYYHLLSGVDLPLKSQNEMHRFFETNSGSEFIGFFKGDISEELTRRVQRIHLFPKYFRETKGLANLCRRFLRYGFLQLQMIFGIKRNAHIDFKKGTQWVSVTNAFVTYLLSQKQSILKMYRNTYCSDEIFVQTICWNSPFREKVFDLNNEGSSCMRKIGWNNGELVTYQLKDFDGIMSSEMLFARKFSSNHIDVVNKIIEKIHGIS